MEITTTPRGTPMPSPICADELALGLDVADPLELNLVDPEVDSAGMAILLPLGSNDVLVAVVGGFKGVLTGTGVLVL